MYKTHEDKSLSRLIIAMIVIAFIATWMLQTTAATKEQLENCAKNSGLTYERCKWEASH